MVKASLLPDFSPGVKFLKGEAQGGRSGSASGARGLSPSRSPVFTGTCRGVAGGKWLTAPPGLPQPGPPATIWKCGTCETSPSHPPGGISGTASCRLETGELWPQAPQSQGRAPGPRHPRRARSGRAPGSSWMEESRWDFSGTAARPPMRERGPPHPGAGTGEPSRPLKGFATLAASPWGL